jgi:hypothetical protein
MHLFATPFLESFSLTAFTVLVFGVVIVSIPLITDMNNLRIVARTGATNIESMVVIGNLVHELQKERGLSTGYIANPAQDQQGLHDQRIVVNRLLTQWHNVSGSLDLTGHAAASRESARVLVHSLGDLRADVLARSIPFPKAVEAYSETIAALLKMSVAIVHATTRGPTTHSALAYCNLLWAKESAGKERATITAALKSRPVPASVRSKCTDLVMSQDMYLRQFAILASPEMQTALKTALNTVDPDVISMRLRALGSDDSRITPENWFETSSRRINVLKSVEDQLAQSMVLGGSQFVSTTQTQIKIARAMMGTSAAAMMTGICLFWLWK